MQLQTPISSSQIPLFEPTSLFWSVLSTCGHVAILQGSSSLVPARTSETDTFGLVLAESARPLPSATIRGKLPKSWRKSIFVKVEEAEQNAWPNQKKISTSSLHIVMILIIRHCELYNHSFGRTMPVHSHLKLSKGLRDSPAPRCHSHNTYYRHTHHHWPLVTTGRT